MPELVPSDPQELIDLYRLARASVWRYELDKMEADVLKDALATLEDAIAEVTEQIATTTGAWTKERLEALKVELRARSADIKAVLADDIATIAGQAGAESLLWHAETLSLANAIPVSFLSITPNQFKAIFEQTPFEGALLKDWIDSAFESSVIDAIANDLNSGILQGKSYPNLIKSIEGYMEDFTEKDMINLTRTYVHSANVAAQEAVMMANQDIIKGWEWCATMETGFFGSGNGTCLACAALDGTFYPNLGQGPPRDLHFGCRCEPLPVLKTWKELGIDAKELDPVAREWRVYADTPIGKGRTGIDLLEKGRHVGNYGSWFETMPDSFKVNVLGPKRFELYQEGKIKFSDLVDKDTGRLKLLSELKGGGGGISGPSMMSSLVKQVESLDDPIKKSLMYYQNSTFLPINEYLRGGALESIPKIEAQIKNLDVACNKCSLPSEATLYRGFTQEAAKNISVGATYIDNGFISTSLKKETADMFASPWMMEIKAKTGTNGVFMGGSLDVGQSEFLLKRGTQFTVESIDKEKNIIYATIKAQ